MRVGYAFPVPGGNSAGERSPPTGPVNPNGTIVNRNGTATSVGKLRRHVLLYTMIYSAP
jgi:hypothetical protein